jgi:hypothetical protein
MAGIFDVYKPTDPSASKPSLVQRIQGLFSRSSGAPGEKAGATEMGVTTTASPSTESFDLWSLRYERQAIIEDVSRLLLEDTRIDRAAWRTAREATRKGFKALVQKTSSRGTHAGRSNRAQAIIDETIRTCGLDDPDWLAGMAYALMRDGDLFPQRVVDGGKLVALKRMPAISMERNTDSQDRFFDDDRAFTQLDIQTQQTVADFASWQIGHYRWKHIPGERYGQSQYIQSRRPARQLMVMEQSQMTRRVVRGPMRIHHAIGNKENPGDARAIADYKANNNLNQQSNGGTNPNVASKDYYTNGIGSITAIPGDPNLEKIEDIEYMQDIYVASLGVPAALINLAVKDINRDILQDQTAEWLKEVQTLTDAISRMVRETLDFALVLAGVDPATVSYLLTFSANSVESPTDHVKRVLLLRQNTRGQGKNAIPDPLISRETALVMLAEVIGLEDAKAELAKLDAEDRALDEKEAAKAQVTADVTAANEPDPEEGADGKDAAKAPGDQRLKRVK